MGKEEIFNIKNYEHLTDVSFKDPPVYVPRIENIIGAMFSNLVNYHILFGSEDWEKDYTMLEDVISNFTNKIKQQ